MPSSGNTPLNEADWEYVKSCYKHARNEGLEFEWLQWFLGGLVENKLSIRNAAENACIEWDI